MKENFLLNTTLAQWLFHECARDLPVIDYHNHLAIDDLAADRNYGNIAELWLLSDPYKHRAMRICGIEEKYITGETKAIEKFKAWMSVLPRLIGNPLYDWSIMEMQRVFRIDLKPGITDAQWLWEQTNSKLAQADYSARKLLSSPFRYVLKYNFTREKRR